MASDINHIDAMRALHDAIINNDAIPDVGSILDQHLPSQAHKDLLQNAAMREAQMTHEGGRASAFDDSLLGNATKAVQSLPEHTAYKLSGLIKSDDPHELAAGVKFLEDITKGPEAEEYTLTPEQNIGAVKGLARAAAVIPERILGFPSDMVEFGRDALAYGVRKAPMLVSRGRIKEDYNPELLQKFSDAEIPWTSDKLIEKARHYGIAPQETEDPNVMIPEMMGDLMTQFTVAPELAIKGITGAGKLSRKIGPVVKKTTVVTAHPIGFAKAGSVSKVINALKKAATVEEEVKNATKAAKQVAEDDIELVSPSAATALLRSGTIKPTVSEPLRIAFPDIYMNPRELVAKANVAPENPLMKQLFGVTRRDLFDISEQGTRQGNITERPFEAAPKAKGARVAPQIMTPENEQRLQDIIAESKLRPELYEGMASWYTMDPLYEMFKKYHGEDAPEKYRRFNILTGMASPGSEVLTELNRGTAANWLANEGRFEDFVKYGGKATEGGRRRPKDLSAIMGHPYHTTSQAGPMQAYLDTGELQMKSAKVPSYILASSVPELGFQTDWPVGDAHWSRLVGLPDVRGTAMRKGKEVIPGASATVPEMVSLAPWFTEKVAKPMELPGVPAQAVVWGAGSHATGVTSPIGAPKLELLAQQVGKAADRLGISPEKALELVIRGKIHAGFADPELLAALGLTGGLGTLAYKYRDLDKDETE